MYSEYFWAIFDFFALVYGVPAGIQNLLIRQPIKDSIAAQHDEIVKIRSELKLRYFWLGYQNALFTPVFRTFGLDIAEGPRNWESTW